MFKSPKLSLILIVYDMPRQARNTLASLTAGYQNNVTESDYEVIVVENASENILGKAAVKACGGNFRYYLREEASVSPVNAINFGVSVARGPVVSIMIDGARLLTPGVIEYILAAYRVTSTAVVAVPGYHLGYELQQKAISTGYSERDEVELLKGIEWPENGYRLFEIACFSGTCVGGYFNPIGESNCLSVPKQLYESIGRCDPRFDMAGGGCVNLDLYKQFCELPGTSLFMLLGEGTFHQLHGGVSTSCEDDKLQKHLAPQFRKQYAEIRGQEYSPPLKKAIYLGTIPETAQGFIQYSSDKVLQRMGARGPQDT